MAIYNDQAIGGNFDPGNPPGLPTTISVISITLNDADNDGFVNANGSDQVNGSNVTRVWEGDTVTIDGTTIVGTTFYTADGSRYFTPTDGSVLPDGGTATATTFVTTSTTFDVNDLGPPCFVSGTLIATNRGEIAVEHLKVGDLVETQDSGFQPIRWIGKRTVSGLGSYAPVRIQKGTLGTESDLFVSPQHRMAISDWRTQLYMGEDQILCSAKALINGNTVTSYPCEKVTYIHFMFDDHQIVYANGSPSESFLAGDYLCNDGSAIQRELEEIFENLPFKQIKSAKRISRSFEATVIASAA
ncbi:Hint domain-containing protein [Cochlodiniinecator piscidefendens]|uniref:Hint domain-containing protein n=1 Tax=Cochlodiniinecator piscidefendens TaxID=2715756 RepID=UPI00140B9F27|nr:Hint domain-containing protein [Cochlodiniinecator piscidefendens]